jgi:hypothetical protein
VAKTRPGPARQVDSGADLGAPVTTAVVTGPATIDHDQRRRSKSARTIARMTSLGSLSLVNVPTPRH